ncbi:MAG: hypothetical protein NXI24_03580 [bacterium]|nr:hypothetical protein [bacterium]
MIKKILLTVLGITLGGALIILLTIRLVVNQPLPEGASGPAAEALTDRIIAATNQQAWKENTAAVEFRFDRRGNEHFYDRRRDFVEVRLPGDEALRVQYNHKNQNQFAAFAGDTPLEGEAAAEALREAIKWHVNDVFWLNPFGMLRAPGTTRKLVAERALLVSYESGGVTPGDSYLIITDENGRPERMQMWVSVIPIRGLEFTFEGWQEFGTGAVFSTIHNNNLSDVTLSDIKTYAAYPEPGTADRFAPLLAKISESEAKSGGEAIQ